MQKLISLYLIFFFTALAGCARDYETDLAVRASSVPGAGNGVYAKVFIPADTLLGAYRGKFITREQHLSLVFHNKWHYVMGLKKCAAGSTGGYTRIDGSDGNVFTRINYAPGEFQNVRFVKICEAPYVQVYSIRDINPGEELFIDYGPNYRYEFMKNPEVIAHFRRMKEKRHHNP